MQLLNFRRQWMSEAQESRILAICAQARVYPADRWNAGLGLLIASAFADEAGGMAPSTLPLFGWLREQAPSKAGVSAVIDEVSEYLHNERRD